MTQQRDKIRYGTISIPYKIFKTRRIKTSEVIVDADTITVRVPFDKDKTEIQKLVLDKASWILRKQKEYRETIPEVRKPSFRENTTLPYLGNNYSLMINKNQTRKIGVGVKQMTIKNLKNRWGSLTKSGAINLNLNLVKAPEDVIDYIVLHELCHIKIKEHSHHYWDLLHKFMPDYHDKAEWLKANGSNLL
jgi:hypothetical protein